MNNARVAQDCVQCPQPAAATAINDDLPETVDSGRYGRKPLDCDHIEMIVGQYR